MTVAPPATDLQATLEELLDRYGVPGASVAVLQDGETTTAAAGVINLNTGVAATTDTLFQIGSITKVYTATLVMQLVDEGLVSLDAPVRMYIPELKLPDESNAAAITVRHLLTHTSGIEGDHFIETGRGDDCIERFVETCATLPQVAPPGRMFSYCNAGFVLLGRVIEKLRDATWDEALKTHLLEPLGVSKTVTLPEEALLHSTAVGHVYDASSGLAVAPRWASFRSGGPAGRINATPSDVLAFAKLHLDGGRDVLSPASVVAMQEPQVELDDPYTLSRWWGLGWEVMDWAGDHLVAHGGTTIGQCASLTVSVPHGFAVCSLTNGWTGGSLNGELKRRLFADRIGLHVPDGPVAADGVAFDASTLAGTYERLSVKLVIEAKDGQLLATVLSEGVGAGRPDIVEVPLRPVDLHTFLLRMPVSESDIPVVFFDFDPSGVPRYAHFGGRAACRV
jgi:CubicO group peptidase (beta-lactamase class C family)